MTFKKAVETFASIHNGFSDYWSMQFAWSCFTDGLCKGGIDYEIDENVTYINY